MGGRYKGYIDCSWRVGINEKAKDVFERFKALEQEEWIWIVSEPWIIREIKVGYEASVVFEDQKKYQFSLVVGDGERLFNEIGGLQLARARLVCVSSKMREPHLNEAVGDWFEGGSVDIEFEICEEGCA